MTEADLRDALDRLARGELASDAVTASILDALRAAPYRDLGFARVDHHRRWRQGFPEVVFGEGKQPAQIAAIAAEIVGRGDPLLVTRATPEAYAAVRAAVPDARYHDL